MTTKTAKSTVASKSPAARKSPAPKAAKKAAAPKKSTRAEVERIGDDSKLTVIAKENPKRGDLARKTFDLYKKAKTVGEWRELCRKHKGDAGYLHADIRHGFIKVS